MIQAIRLMSLPIHELKEEMQIEIERNPALEIVEDRSTVSLESLGDEHAGDADIQTGPEDISDPGYARGSTEDSDAKRNFLEGAISVPETLQEHLLWQLRLYPISPALRDAGELLIQNLDSDGFHKEDPFSVCPNIQASIVEAAIEIIQKLDPIGVCTRDYRQSLIIQTQAATDAPFGSLDIVRDYIDLLEHGKLSDIQKKLRLSDKQFETALTFVKGLNPFPGRQYSPLETRFVIPDVQVKLKDGEFVITINDEEIPVLGINPFFDQLSEAKHDKATDSFVKDNIKQAKWFIQSIHQRNRTLLKVMRSIVEFQRSFFIRGPKYLAPLTLKDIANEVGVHETTISRIAGKKYVQTDFGIFELRYFFTNSISGSGSSGSRFSKEGVKQIIKELISNESNIMSDQDIAELLSRKGIKLARRTVSKYRGELHVDSSFSRKHS